ncbi:MAG: SIMPL domain-containing protein [Candidatus Giovannonibacteria bacterium]|nr:MAG: SIMPL domain-containing protein [Candidatus Giovannonibacteria bacterium]
MEINESKYLHIRPPKEALWALVIFLAVLIVFFGARTWNEVNGTNRPFPSSTISVSGEGKVFVKPDVAVVNIGVVKQGADLVSTQRSATDVINKVLEMLKREGVEDKDVKTTSYSISPRYDYKDGTQIFRGYEIHQNLEVKIRDLGKVGSTLSRSAEFGANQVGSIQFTVDDPKAAKEEARAAAIKDAREKAAKLAKSLNINLKKLVSYSESGGGFPPPVPIYGKAVEFGLGGDFPALPSGENEINIFVTLTYEIR